MTPDLIHDLIYAATGDKKKAIEAQIQLELSQMPEPKNARSK